MSNVGNGKRGAFRELTNVGRNVGNGKAYGGDKKRANTGSMTTRSMSVGGVDNNNTVKMDCDDNRNNIMVSTPLTNGGKKMAKPTSYQMTGKSDDIDERDKTDPLCVTEYVESIYNHNKNKEKIMKVQPNFMENKQSHINERMRAILVDWLVEVHLKFKLVPETLYLTIHLIDRFLSIEEVPRPKLQLVGVTSLLIASKYEEIYPPELRDLVYICDRAYTRQDIIDQEEHILKVLDYKVTAPSAHAFLVRYLKAGHADKKIVQLSCYLLDGCLQNYSLLDYLPSQLAGAVIFIARRHVNRNGWSPTLLKYSNYCEEEIIPVARAILNVKLTTNTELKAVNKKYSTPRYGGVAATDFTIDF